jgi:Lsr2
MAQRIIEQYIDDLDGCEGSDVATVQFALDGVQYEIDLSKANHERLREALSDFVGSARRTGGRLRVASSGNGNGGGGRRSGPNPKVQAIRDWARTEGLAISDRGRVPATVRERYEEAQKQSAVKAPATKTRSTRSKAAASTPEFSADEKPQPARRGRKSTVKAVAVA